MWQLALRMARRRITSLIAVACAVLGGAALVTATGVLAESGLRSHLPADRLESTSIVVAAPQTYRGSDIPLALPERAPVPADLAARLAQLPGVTAAVNDVSLAAAVLDRDGQVVSAGDPQSAGRGWSSRLLLARQGFQGSAPVEASDVAISRDIARGAGLRVGDTAQIVVGGRQQEFRVTALTAAPGAGVLFRDDIARSLAGSDDTVDLVGVQVREGMEDSVADAIHDELRGTNLVVATGASRGDTELPGAVAARSLLVVLAASLAGVILFLIGFIVAGALSTSVHGQRRELALLRAVGSTPRQIRRLVAGEATVVGAVAAVPGIAMGYLLAEQFRRVLADLDVIPAQLPLTISPLPALAAVLTMFALVQVAARGSSWRASRMPATEAVAESRSEPRTPSARRNQVGLLMVLIAMTLSIAPLLTRSALGAAATSLAGILAAIGLALCGPTLVRSIGRILARRLPESSSPAAWLAAQNTHAYPLRVAGAITTLAMALVFTLTYAFAQTTLAQAQTREVETATLSDRTITAAGLGGIPQGMVEQVRTVPGVRAAAPVGATTVLWSQRMFGEEEVESVSAQILDPAAAGVLDLDISSGRIDQLEGDAVAISSDAARADDLEVGDRVKVRLGDGAQVSVRVVAVYQRNLGFGPVVISRDLGLAHTTSGMDQSIAVRTDGTAGAQQALEAVVRSYSGTSLEGGGPQGSTRIAPEVWINAATIMILLGYLLLGIANKLVAMTAQRRHEIAALRLNGMTTRQVAAMLRQESAIIAVVAIVGGIAVSIVPLALLGVGFLERPWPAGPVWLLPSTALIIVGITAASIGIPARRLLKLPPAQVLSQR